MIYPVDRMDDRKFHFKLVFKTIVSHMICWKFVLFFKLVQVRPKLSIPVQSFSATSQQWMKRSVPLKLRLLSCLSNAQKSPI